MGDQSNHLNTSLAVGFDAVGGFSSSRSIDEQHIKMRLSCVFQGSTCRAVPLIMESCRFYVQLPKSFSTLVAKKFACSQTALILHVPYSQLYCSQTALALHFKT